MKAHPRDWRPEDRVIWAAWYWWPLILGGLGLLFAQGHSAAVHSWWIEHVHPLPRMEIWAWLFYACIPIHVWEAWYAHRVATRKGMTGSAAGWAFQTFMLGYPSTRLLLAVGRPPGPKGRFLVGIAETFKAQPLKTAIALHENHGDVVRMPMAHMTWFLITHPEDIHDVNVRRQNLFYKPALARRLWKPFLGEGVLTAEGEDWQKQSRMMRPAFHKKRIDAYATSMVQYTHEWMERLSEGQAIDVSEDMTSLTLRIVAKTLFDADVQRDAATVGSAMLVLNEVLLEHLYLPLPKWWPSQTNKRKWKALDDIESIVKGIIQERRSTGEDRGDLLSTLVFARDEQGQGMSDKLLRDQAMTLFFAGHETTSGALTWMWYLLSRNPEVETRLHEEITGVVGDGPITVEALGQLPYLEMVVKESMRILPSVWTYMREPQEDIWLGGYFIPKGATVMISPYVTQHDARFFEDPEVFRPERFSPENQARIPAGARMA